MANNEIKYITIPEAKSKDSFIIRLSVVSRREVDVVLANSNILAL